MPKTLKTPPASMDKFLVRGLKAIGPAEPPETAIGIYDKPEFWLGQISAVAELERCNRLTRNEGMKAVQDVLKRMRVQDNERSRLAVSLSHKTKM